jgi:hypothetical protein
MTVGRDVLKSALMRLKTDPPLRDAVLNLLDVLVSTGSSAAYGCVTTSSLQCECPVNDGPSDVRP